MYTVNDKIRLLETLDSLPSKVTGTLIDVEYRFSGDRRMCDTVNNIVYLKQEAPSKVMLHEAGHILEKKLFSKKEVRELKKRYTEGLSVMNIVKEVYQTESK